ncbi:SDR family oxidoreductase [Paenibacillus popilliae]|uniref:SDR family oxidoreductase n=1 Tax=Paenibacillus popilliae TaxID=78057 RepID=A0ABY3AK05_PAEPP|nr:SDR family oxidoreductase [Paenibacillus sp. SDF0028]TQR42594.1 SDR family oxidoreductase [Paenibacillus sp. SDF0028]
MLTSPHTKSQHSNASPSRPIAVVTGTSSGFGLYTSVALAGAGYDVVATMRNTTKQGKLLAEAQTSGVSAYIHVLQLDVTNPESIEAAFEHIRQQYGRVDLLVNNAGYAAGGCVEEVDMDAWHAQLEANFFGTVAVTRAALPIMREQGNGTIVNVSSISGRYAFPGYAPYAASKFAVEGFTEALRLEMLPFGIYAVLVEPGAYKTDIWEKGFSSIQIHENSPYSKLLQAVLQFSKRSSETAPPPQEVARHIVRIARTPRPKLRYFMGRGAMPLRLIRLLPWKWYERLVLWALRR